MIRDKDFYSIGEVAELFGLSADAILVRMTKEKWPYVVTTGGARRFFKDDICKRLDAETLKKNRQLAIKAARARMRRQ